MKYDRHFRDEPDEQCIKCSHLKHFHLTQFKQEGARKYPVGHRCMMCECVIPY
jgi:hypothetical protein